MTSHNMIAGEVYQSTVILHSLSPVENVPSLFDRDAGHSFINNEPTCCLFASLVFSNKVIARLIFNTVMDEICTPSHRVADHVNKTRRTSHRNIYIEIPILDNLIKFCRDPAIFEYSCFKRTKLRNISKQQNLTRLLAVDDLPMILFCMYCKTNDPKIAF